MTENLWLRLLNENHPGCRKKSFDFCGGSYFLLFLLHFFLAPSIMLSY